MQQLMRTRLPGIRTGWSRRLALAGSGCLMLVAGACTAAPASDTSSPPALTSPCGATLLVGVRGSGESASQQMALGPTLFDIYTRIRRDNPHTAMSAFGLPYAANTISNATASDAATGLIRLLQSRARQCPGERLMVAGYSLGAQIVADAAQDPATTQLADHRAGIVILADPHFNPRDTATAAGTFDPATAEHRDGHRSPSPSLPRFTATVAASTRSASMATPGPARANTAATRYNRPARPPRPSKRRPDCDAQPADQGQESPPASTTTVAAFRPMGR